MRERYKIVLIPKIELEVTFTLNSALCKTFFSLKKLFEKKNFFKILRQFFKNKKKKKSNFS